MAELDASAAVVAPAKLPLAVKVTTEAKAPCTWLSPGSSPAKLVRLTDEDDRGSCGVDRVETTAALWLLLILARRDVFADE